MLLNSNLSFVIGFIAILHGLSILTVYHLGRLIFKSYKVGLVSAFFFTVSTAEIFYARSLMGNSLIIPVTLLSFLFFIKYLKGTNKNHLYLSYGLIYFSGFFNLSQLVIIFIYAFLVLIKERNILFTFLTNTLPLVIFVILNLPLLLFLKNNPVNNVLHFNFPINALPMSIYLFLESVFPIDNGNILPGGLVLLMLFAGNLIYSRKFLRPLFLPLAFILITVLTVAILNNRGCCSSYFTAVYPFYYLISAYLVCNLIKRTKKITSLIAFIFLLSLIYFFTNDLKPMYVKYEAYPLFEKVADLLIADAKNRNLDNFQVLVGDKDRASPNFWHSPTLWYFLEKKLNKKFIKVSNITESNLELAFDSQTIYLFCEANSELLCRKNFRLHYSNYAPKYKLQHNAVYLTILYEAVNWQEENSYE